MHQTLTAWRIVPVIVAVIGCTPARDPAATSRAPHAPPPASTERAAEPLPQLHGNDPELVAKVRSIAARNDAELRDAAAERLIELASEINSEAWFRAARDKVMAANANARLDPTPEQLKAQIEAWRTEKLSPLFQAMRVLRAQRTTAWLVGIAENRALPGERRELALNAAYPLEWGPNTARAEIERSIHESPKPDLGIPDAARTVAGMRAGFRTCFDEQLKIDASFEARVRLTLKVGVDGVVTAVELEPEPPAPFGDCLRTAASAHTFTPPTNGKPAVVVVPVTFVRQ